MLIYAIGAAAVMIAVAMGLNLWRLAVGPARADRILALDTLAINAIALVVLFGVLVDSTVYIEAALVIAMMGFVGTAALCKYLLSGDVIE